MNWSVYKTLRYADYYNTIAKDVLLVFIMILNSMSIILTQTTHTSRNSVTDDYQEVTIKSYVFFKL